MRCAKCGRPAENGSELCDCGAAAIREALAEEFHVKVEFTEAAPASAEEQMNRYLFTKRAQAVTRRWNRKHPDREACIEWAEEAAIAFAASSVYGATPAGLEWERRMLEFTTKLPIELVEAIFGGKDIP